ncbi:MAG: porin family protein [Bacteroidota bacterium]
MRITFVLIAFIGIIFTSQAQPTVTLLTFESYSFSDRVTTSDGYEGEIGDGFQWGGGLEFGLQETMAVELIYQRLNTEGYLQRPLSIDRGSVAVNYFMLGGTRYMPVSETVSGFGTVDLGLGVLGSPDNSSDGNVEKFAWGLRLGVRIAPSEKVSIRLHGQLMSAVQAVGGGLYFGTGGAGAGVTGFSTFYQFNLGGSVNIRIK